MGRRPYLLFGLAFWMATSPAGADPGRGRALLLVGGQAGAVLSLVALPPCFGLEGALLVLVALQLGGLLPRGARPGLDPRAERGPARDPVAALGLALGRRPRRRVPALSTDRRRDGPAARRETAARERLAAANAELEATRELLAQSARLAERAAIGRDLHDLLGHHLTALSLNLEIASHQTEGDARARVETAQSVTKLLLGDVRAVVGSLRPTDRLDLPAALQKLADGIPRPRIHIAVVPDLAVEDPVTGEVVLRCAQEIVTNAVRHAQRGEPLARHHAGRREHRDPGPRRRPRRGRGAAFGPRPRGDARTVRAPRRLARRRDRPGQGLPDHCGPSDRRLAVVIRVFLVEDQALVREGIRSLLALDPAIGVVATASRRR